MADLVRTIFTRIDSSSNWKTLNPVPRNGEQCIEALGNGLFKLKVGDGVTPWIALNYWTSTTDAAAQTILSVTEKYPLEAGKYYDLTSAIRALSYQDIHLGMMMMFEVDDNVWETWQLNSSKKSLYLDSNNWKRISQSISSVIFNNEEEGEIENGAFLTKLQSTHVADDLNELMTLTYSFKDIITGFNKIDKIVLRSSDKTILGLYDDETNTLDIQVSPYLIKKIEEEIDKKVDKTFADATGAYVEGQTIYVDSTLANGLITKQTTLVNVVDGNTKTQVIDIISDEKTIKLSHSTTDLNTNLNVNVDPDNLIIDLGEF